MELFLSVSFEVLKIRNFARNFARKACLSYICSGIRCCYVQWL